MGRLSWQSVKQFAGTQLTWTPRMISGMKWLEPVGQAMILIAVGLQLYHIEPNSSRIIESFLNEIKSGKCIPPEKAIGTTKIGVDFLFCDRPHFERTIAKLEKDTYKKIYAYIFFSGGIFVILGKCASLWASKK